jgi:nucleolar protein 14
MWLTTQTAPKVTGDNPFETRKNKTRFSVLGRKVKGTVVKSGKSNQVLGFVFGWATTFILLQESHKRREQTLGAEFETRGKSGRFVDKRFGERDAEMAEADKMGVRFQQERLRQARNLFSLTGAEELTHLGMSLGADKQPGAPNTLEDDLFFRVNDDDEAFGGEGGLMDETTVKQLHFGGGEAEGETATPGGQDDEAPRKKTRREVRFARCCRSFVLSLATPHYQR